MEKFDEMAWSEPKDSCLHDHNPDPGLIFEKMLLYKVFMRFTHMNQQ